MNRMIPTITLFVVLMLVAAPRALTQTGGSDEPSESLISIYHIAPGQHLAFLQWMTARGAIGEKLGIPATQWYAHLDGDSWDYVAIGPVTTDEQDRAVDAAAKAQGLTSGFAAGIELRHLINSHTDTFALGPISAADLVALAQGN